MKKTVIFLFTLIMLLQTSFSALAFTDSSANPYTGLKYTHDDDNESATISNGVDVSYYQNSINWTKVKADGIDFAFIRAGFRGYGSAGTLVNDDKFTTHTSGALSAGLDIGVYFYSQAITTAEATAEAELTLDIISGYDIKLPVVFDFEYDDKKVGRLYNANLTDAQRTNICLAFCKRIEQAGYTAMVYANYSMLTNDLNDDTIAKYYDVWLADYNTSPTYNKKYYDCPYTFWQYNSQGSVSGISGNADCNFRYVKAPAKISGLTASNQTETSLKLTWGKSIGCAGYRVYQYSETTGSYSAIKTISGASKRTYTITGLTAGTNYKYKVRAFKYYQGSRLFGSYSNELSTRTSFDVTTKVNSQTSTTISWEPVENTDGYEVLRSTSKDGDYLQVCDATSTQYDYTDEQQNPFTTYYYKVRSYVVNDSTRTYPSISDVMTVSKSQPEIKSAILKTRKSVTLTWTGVSGATGTAIYRKVSGGKYSRVYTASATSSSYTDTKLTLGKTYYYKVRQYIKINNKNYYSSYTTYKYATTLATPTVSLKASSKAVTVSWKKVSGASRYAIYMKTKSQKSYKLVKTCSASYLNKKITSLKSGTKYYFRVRAYKVYSDKNVYSAYSATRYATAK